MTMNKLRSQYLYQLKGTIRGQQLRKIPTNPQPFYQLNITCETNSTITKLYVFKPKTNPSIWQTLEQNLSYGKKYFFYCKNYRGYYHLTDWKLLSRNGSQRTESESLPSCQYQAPNCQKIATYQHILKLGSLAIEKQWVCSNCKQILENSHDQ